MHLFQDGKMRTFLSDRENQIVSWLIQGLSNKEIADKVGLVEKTVKWHLSNVYKITGSKNRLNLTVQFHKRVGYFEKLKEIDKTKAI